MNIDQLTFLINKLHNSIFYIFSLFFEEFYNFIIKVVKIPWIWDNFEKIIGHLTNRPFLFFTIIIYSKQYLITLLNEIVTLVKKKWEVWMDAAVGNNATLTKATKQEKELRDKEEVSTEIFEDEKKLIIEGSISNSNLPDKKKEFIDRLKKKRERETKINEIISKYIIEFENENEIWLKYESEVKIKNRYWKTFIWDWAVIMNWKILFLLEILIHTANSNSTDIIPQRIDMMERRSMEKLRYYKFNFDTLLIVLSDTQDILDEDNEDIKILRISEKHLNNSDFKSVLFSKIRFKIYSERMNELNKNKYKHINWA